MKINRLETHDRLQHLKKDQGLNLSQGCEDCLKRNSLSLSLQHHSPYIYIFAHPRTAEDGVNKRMLWQPRLSRPSAQTNSYLFRAESHSDIVEVIWMIPPKELWDQYIKGNMMENETILWSINQYMNNRKGLEASHPEDLPEERQKYIYRAIRQNIGQIKMMDNLYLPTQVT